MGAQQVTRQNSLTTPPMRQHSNGKGAHSIKRGELLILEKKKYRRSFISRDKGEMSSPERAGIPLPSRDVRRGGRAKRKKKKVNKTGRGEKSFEQLLLARIKRERKKESSRREKRDPFVGGRANKINGDNGTRQPQPGSL